MTEEEIKIVLISETRSKPTDRHITRQIMDAKDVEQAIGIAVKFFEMKGLEVLDNEIKNVVEEIRNNKAKIKKFIIEELMTEEEQIEYVNEGHPYRTSDGKVFQNFSELSLHNGFWWFDSGCAIAPEGCEQNLPIIDNGPKWTEGKTPKGVYLASGRKEKEENKIKC